jgi:hypothetical protein
MCKSFEGAVNAQVAKVESPGTVLPFAGQVWYLALLDEDAQLAWLVVERRLPDEASLSAVGVLLCW